MAKRKPIANKPGVNETVVEMAAEMHDPAMWATLQLTKPTADPPKTVGDAHDRIRSIFRQAIDMELRRTGVTRLIAVCRENVGKSVKRGANPTATTLKFDRIRAALDEVDQTP